MKEEFSFFDLKRMHSFGLGPPAGSGPAQRFTPPPPPPPSCGQLQPLHPTLGGERPHTPPVAVTVLSLQAVIWLWLQHPFSQGISTQSVNLSRTASVSIWGKGDSAEGHSSSLKRGDICWKNRTVKHRGGKAEIPYMESGGYMAYIGTLQDPCPDTSTPADLCSPGFQWLNSGTFFTEYCYGKNISIPITLNINLILFTIWNNKGKNAVSTHWTFGHSFASGKLAFVQISEMLPSGHQSHRIRLLRICFLMWAQNYLVKFTMITIWRKWQTVLRKGRAPPPHSPGP